MLGAPSLALKPALLAAPTAEKVFRQGCAHASPHATGKTRRYQLPHPSIFIFLKLSEVPCMAVSALFEDHNSLFDCVVIHSSPLMEDKQMLSVPQSKLPFFWSPRSHCSINQERARPQSPGSRGGLTQKLRKCQPPGLFGFTGPCEVLAADGAPLASKLVSAHFSCVYGSISQELVKRQILIQWVQVEACNSAL